MNLIHLFEMNVSDINSIIQEYKVSEEDVKTFLESNEIRLKGDLIPKKYQDQIVDFAESIDTRLSKVLDKAEREIMHGNNLVSIFKDDAIGFLKKLPTNSVDLIVTDPAYSGMNNKLMLGKGRIVGQYKDKGTDNGKWFGEFEDSEENYHEFLSECKRVLKTSTGHIYIMFDSFSLLSLGSLVREYFDVKNLITWDKVNIGMGHYFRRRHEYIVFATNENTRKIRNRKFPDVWRFKRIHNSPYPTQKPVEVFQAMVHASGEEGFVVCDPFLGSGSAAMAAVKNNCNFIGCDISDKSIEMSYNRLSKYVEEGNDILQKNSCAVDENIFWE